MRIENYFTVNVTIRLSVLLHLQGVFKYWMIGARMGYRYNTKAKPLLIFLPPVADFFTLNIYFT